MLIEVGKFTFPVNFVILELEKDSKVPFILVRPFLHTADAVIRVKQKQLNLRVGTERMIFDIDYAMKYSYSNDDTCFSIDVIDEILEEDFNALIDEGSEILHSIKGTILKEKLFTEFDEFMFEHEHVVMNPTLMERGFPAQIVRSSNVYALYSPYLLALNTGTSQSKQHGMSESDSYYLSD
nr:reverse transcriptase domain-containing protein [Tanacetum cinerariifolium]